ncbi:MAG: AraC family transcriptional regulator [Pleomorphochaeta sp.]
MAVKRISYNNKYKKNTNFEIVTIKDFFNRVKLSYLKKDFRLDFYSLIYITKGSSFHSINFVEYEIKKDNILVLEKNKIHSFRNPRDLEGYIININEAFFNKGVNRIDFDLLSFFEMPIESPILNINTDKKETNRNIIDLLYKEYENGEYSINKEKLLNSLFNSFVHSVSLERKNNSKAFTINSYKIYFKYRDLVNEYYKTYKDVKDYESMMGVTYKTINKATKECTDISAKQIIINKIILETKRLLVLNELSNAEIAYELGFLEPSNLSHFFKIHAKVNMKEFKKINRD